MENKEKAKKHDKTNALGSKNYLRQQNSSYVISISSSKKFIAGSSIGPITLLNICMFFSISLTKTPPTDPFHRVNYTKLYYLG
jgi:hypothetical protein